MSHVDRVEAAVRRKIADEERRARGVLDTIPESSIREFDLVIARLFPEMSRLAEPVWSNVPRDVRLSHYLLIGVPAIVDLRAMAPEPFEAFYGVSIAAMAELARQGWVVLSLYERSAPGLWAGATHLEPLLEHVIVNGARTDAYIARLVPDYPRRQAERRAEFRAALSTAADEVKAQALVRAYQTDLSVLPVVVGNQWAYVDAVAPESSRVVGHLVEHGRLGDAVAVMRTVRRSILSRHTGALGGDYVWSDQDFGRWTLARPGTASSAGAPPVAAPSEDVAVAPGRGSAAFRWTATEFRTIPGLPVVARPPVAPLLELHRRPEWQVLRSGTISLVRDLAAAIEHDRYAPRQTEQLRHTVRAMREMLEAWGLAGDMATVKTSRDASVTIGIGVLADPCLGTMSSGAVGEADAEIEDHVTGETSETIRRTFRSSQHRIVGYLDRIATRIIRA